MSESRDGKEITITAIIITTRQAVLSGRIGASQPAAQPCESETKEGLERKAAIPMSKTVTLTRNALLVSQRAVYLSIRAP